MFKKNVGGHIEMGLVESWISDIFFRFVCSSTHMVDFVGGNKFRGDSVGGFGVALGGNAYTWVSMYGFNYKLAVWRRRGNDYRLRVATVYLEA